MMTGTITNLRPHITLPVRGAGGQGIFEFTIDTGYSGTLTLSAAQCLALKLPVVNRIVSSLADGSEITLNVHRLFVEWDGEERLVEILAIGEEPLLGATMLEGYKLCLDYSTNMLTVELP